MIKIVGLAGLAGSGKSYAARCLKQHGYENTKFAGPIKMMYTYWLSKLGITGIPYRIEGEGKEKVDQKFIDGWHYMHDSMCTSILDRSVITLLEAGCITSAQVEPLCMSLREWANEHLFNTDITPRYIMQRLGTEWGRSCHGDDFWVDMWERSIVRKSGLITVDDVRFKNEAKRIKELGGIIIHIHGKNKPGDHESEQIDFDADVLIRNTYDYQFPKLIEDSVLDDG